ncbi:MAG: hypothetical protein FWF68_08925 [Spirochaetes bacterium]|nr:hypothetical protein [Brevinematales bacterium]MCL1959709.1 hypothetical protein [Spirochaetota bacterium]
MMRLFCLFSIFNLFILIIPVSAQNKQLSSTGTQERRQALVLDINSRVLENGKKVIWSENNHKTSISGVPVGVQVVGSNIVVVVQFTPYIRNDGNVLVVQGQIWIAEPEKGVTYFTSIQTVPMVFGEPVYFFPLGESQNLDPSIEIIITVNPYNRTSPNSGNVKP